MLRFWQSLSHGPPTCDDDALPIRSRRQRYVSPVNCAVGKEMTPCLSWRSSSSSSSPAPAVRLPVAVAVAVVAVDVGGALVVDAVAFSVGSSAGDGGAAVGDADAGRLPFYHEYLEAPSGFPGGAFCVGSLP